MNNKDVYKMLHEGVNMQVYTCGGSDNGLLSLETKKNGSFTLKAQVNGKPLKTTYYFATKVQAIKAFRHEAMNVYKSTK